MKVANTLILLASSCISASTSFAFQTTGTTTRSTTSRISMGMMHKMEEQDAIHRPSNPNSHTRRDIFKRMTSSSLPVLLLTLSSTPLAAQASGGATAGGAYLLSAKQRYNDRVTQGVTNFKQLGSAIDSGNLDALRNFFATEDVGGWKDFSSAGYLLANAFRRSSSTAPDSLPSVKGWKAYAASVENMTKALKKKDTAGASKAYQDAIQALNAYLELVELPPVSEIVASTTNTAN